MNTSKVFNHIVIGELQRSGTSLLRANLFIKKEHFLCDKYRI